MITLLLSCVYPLHTKAGYWRHKITKHFTGHTEEYKKAKQQIRELEKKYIKEIREKSEELNKVVRHDKSKLDRALQELDNFESEIKEKFEGEVNDLKTDLRSQGNNFEAKDLENNVKEIVERLDRRLKQAEETLQKGGKYTGRFARKKEELHPFGHESNTRPMDEAHTPLENVTSAVNHHSREEDGHHPREENTQAEEKPQNKSMEAIQTEFTRALNERKGKEVEVYKEFRERYKEYIFKRGNVTKK